MRRAIIDSSTLINLAHLNLATRLSQFFGAVYVPRAVQIEVNRRSRFRYRLAKLYAAGLFQRCAVSDPVSVRLLRPALQEGEAEALVQAQEREVRFLLCDDKQAREISQNMGIRPVGTVTLLARMHLEGFAEDTWSLVRRLRRDLRFRATDSVVATAIRTAEEPI